MGITNTTVSDIGKSARQIAIDTAKKIAHEPAEILRSTREQVIPGITNSNADEEKPADLTTEPKSSEINSRDQGRIKELEEEARQIANENLYKSLMGKIQKGEQVYTENETSLSPEQKQVLRAQQEIFLRNQKILNTPTQEVQVSSKPSRNYRPSAKTAAQKQTTRVEKILPVSG